jgi:hypothetical protein
VTDLDQLFRDATDHVASPDLAGRALAEAHRRRVRRTAVGALAAVVLLGGGVAWVAQAPTPKAGVVDTPVPTPSQEATVVGPRDLEAQVDLPTPPPIDEAVIQPRWDPGTAAELPRADIGLPQDLTPPGEAAELTSLPHAVALVQLEATTHVVGADGRWWRLPLPEEPLAIGEWRTESPRLSTDGTWIALPGRTALWARELAGTGWRRIEYPRGFLRSRMFPRLVPRSGAGFVLARHREWLVDLDSGSVDERSEQVSTLAWGDGVFVGSLGSAYGMRLLSWGAESGPQATFRTDYLQSLTGMAASADSLAAVRGVGAYNVPRAPAERNGLIALRLDDLSTRAYLPIEDPGYAMTDGELMAVEGWLGPDTVLASVGTMGADLSEGVRTLFTWDIATGDLRRVSSLPAAPTFDVALDALQE